MGGGGRQFDGEAGRRGFDGLWEDGRREQRRGRGNPLAAEEVREFLEGTGDAFAGGFLSGAEGGPGFAQTQVAEKPQHQRLAVSFGKRGHRLVQQREQFSRAPGLVIVVGGGMGFHVFSVYVFPRAPAQIVALPPRRFKKRRFVEPAPDIRLVAEPRRLRRQRQKNILSHIGGQVAAPELSQRRTIYHVLVTPDQLTERRLIAIGGEGAQQLGVGQGCGHGKPSRITASSASSGQFLSFYLLSRQEFCPVFNPMEEAQEPHCRGSFATTC